MSKRTTITVLTIATALIHLALGIGDLTSASPTSLAVPFILNGLGYLSLLAALYYIPQLATRRVMVRYALMGLAAITFVLYFVFQGSDAFSSVPGLVTKVIEIALIATLYLDR